MAYNSYTYNSNTPGMGELQQIPKTITPYYQPYIDWGRDAGGLLSDYYSNMLLDPEGRYNEIMAGYNQTPNYQYQQEQMMKQAQGNAAAGGFTGTDYDQQKQMEMTQGLLSKDQQDYLSAILGMQGQGASGEQGLFDTGYKASTGLAEDLGSNLAQQSGLKYRDYYNEEQRKMQEDFNSFQKNMAYMKMFSQGIGSLMGSK